MYYENDHGVGRGPGLFGGLWCFDNGDRQLWYGGCGEGGGEVGGEGGESLERSGKYIVVFYRNLIFSASIKKAEDTQPFYLNHVNNLKCFVLVIDFPTSNSILLSVYFVCR